LKKAILDLQEPATLFGFWLHGLNPSLQTRQEIHQLRSLLVNDIIDAAKGHQIVLSLDEDEGLWLLLSTTDKRIHQRIAAEVQQTFAAQVLTFWFIHDPLELRIGAIILQKDHDLASILSKLELTRPIKTSQSMLTYYDKTLIADLNRIEVLRAQFNERIIRKEMPLRYNQIGNLLTRKVEMYRAFPETESLLGEYQDFCQMIDTDHRETELFTLTSTTLFKQIAETLETSTFEVQYGLEVPLVVLKQRPLIEELHKRVKKAKITTGHLVWILKSIDDTDIFKTNFLFLKEKGYKLAYETGLNGAVALSQESPQLFDYVMISSAQYNDYTKPWFDVLVAKFKPMVIMTQVDDSLLAETLKSNRLSTIEGTLLAHNLAFEALKTKLH
jgi:hypothetical protein